MESAERGVRVATHARKNFILTISFPYSCLFEMEEGRAYAIEAEVSLSDEELRPLRAQFEDELPNPSPSTKVALFPIA